MEHERGVWAGKALFTGEEHRVSDRVDVAYIVGYQLEGQRSGWFTPGGTIYQRTMPRAPG